MPFATSCGHDAMMQITNKRFHFFSTHGIIVTAAADFSSYTCIDIHLSRRSCRHLPLAIKYVKNKYKLLK